MLEYEDFLYESFPQVFVEYKLELEFATSCPIDKVRKKAINFLECSCNAKYGFFGEAHTNSDLSKSNSVFMIPTSYESALLLPYIINEGIDQIVVNTIISVLKRSQRSSGFWNYFFDAEHKNRSFSLIPDDIDDTAVPAYALYIANQLTLSECRSLGKKLLKETLVEPSSGVIATWIPNEERKIILNSYQNVPRVCPGCLTNYLWFNAVIGMDNEPEMISSIDFINLFVDELIKHKGNDDVLLPAMGYYINKYVHLFFIARFIQNSEYARKIFGLKFGSLLIEEVELLATKSNSKALNIALLILAVWHLSLHQIEEKNILKYYERKENEIIESMRKLCERLLVLQNKDGSFSAWKVYKWNGKGDCGGSKVVTTGLVLAALGIAKREIRKINFTTN